MTEFSKQVKHALIDQNKTLSWLTQEVKKKTGLSSDISYISKIVSGNKESQTVTKAIKEILGIE